MSGQVFPKELGRRASGAIAAVTLGLLALASIHFATDRSGGSPSSDTVTAPIISIDTSEVLEGKRAEVERAIGELVVFVERNVPRAIAYQVFLDDQGKTMTVLQVHPDSASMEQHMKVSAPVFAQFKGLVRLSTLDVYGTPSEGLRAKLRDKALMLGGTGPTVHAPFAGFSRFGSR